MAFKFNSGRGAIICDACRIIIKSPCLPNDYHKELDLCSECNEIIEWNDAPQTFDEMLAMFDRLSKSENDET